MKILKALLFAAALASSASAVTISVTGVDDNGYGGIYNIDGQNYWWMCVEPGPVFVNPVPSGVTLTANALSIRDAWDRQNTERHALFTADPSLYVTAIPMQVAAMEYVLDTYLPWDTLAGPSGRFIEQDGNSANYGNNEAFYNSFFVVQNFLAETYGKTNKSDFTDMSDFVDYNQGIGTDAGIARSTLFQSILADVENKAALNFFETYEVQRGYYIANSFFALNDPENWQDALIITSFPPVPEPGGAILIAACGVAILLRRRRSLA